MPQTLPHTHTPICRATVCLGHRALWVHLFSSHPAALRYVPDHAFQWDFRVCSGFRIPFAPLTLPFGRSGAFGPGQGLEWGLHLETSGVLLISRTRCRAVRTIPGTVTVVHPCQESKSDGCVSLFGGLSFAFPWVLHSFLNRSVSSNISRTVHMGSVPTCV